MSSSSPIPPALPRDISSLLDQRLTQLESACRAAGVPFYDDAGVDDHLERVLLASDFAFETLLRDPISLGPELVRLMGDPRHADARVGALMALESENDTRRELRRFRKNESIRLIWRDVNNLDPIETTLAGASVLAECCIEAALRQAERQVQQRHGVVRNADGVVQRMVVIALGKLGGDELNFSSDVDVILAYPEDGTSDGARSLDASTWFTRLGQQLVSLLAETSVDGIVYRVDLRLRPFGTVGRIALSFSAMELYYQREGRDWERYAWIKARPVAGDKVAGNDLLRTLRPFVFRRYLDYTAFAGLREMKSLIDAEVARKDLAANLKLGPGGIREIEFIVQLQQMIRGGREPVLRERGLLPALAACERLGLVPSARAKRLREAYRFLRRVENRLQMFADQQTHDVPDDAQIRLRIALALGYADWPALQVELDRHRAAVSEEFDAVMAPTRRAKRGVQLREWSALWQRFRASGCDADALSEAGFDAPDEAVAAIDGLLGSPIVRAAATLSRERLDRVMPTLLAAAAESVAPVACLTRFIGLVQAVARRSAYLALLDEQPVALKRLTYIFAASALLADQVIAHPLLLDELLDENIGADADRESLGVEIARRLAAMPEHDPEVEIELVQELRLAAQFRIGLAFLYGRSDALATAGALAEVAEAILAALLRMAERDLVTSHGCIDGAIGDGAGMAVIGYGSLGGGELGFSSDLDLIFLYDGDLAQRESSGPKVLDGARYYARLAQRFVHLLTTLTRFGRSYEIDIRLRPEGTKGLLVTPVEAYIAYQRERAWTWEHQALVRGRAVAGDRALARQFVEARQAALETAGEATALRTQIVDMRSRWRAERDRSGGAHIDLKQGAGALVDIEFIMQALVLLHGREHPELFSDTNTAALIKIAFGCGVLGEAQAADLASAHALLLARSLAATLDARPRVVVLDAEIDAATAMVTRIAHDLELPFA